MLEGRNLLTIETTSNVIFQLVLTHFDCSIIDSIYAQTTHGVKIT